MAVGIGTGQHTFYLLKGGAQNGKSTKKPVDKKAVGQKGRTTAAVGQGRGTGRPAFLTPLGHEGKTGQIE